MAEPAQHKSCTHVQEGLFPATVTVAMRSITGAPTRADVNTVTHLCAACAGLVVQALMRVEGDACFEHGSRR